MRKIAAIVFLLILTVIGIVLWLNTQETMEGYVQFSDESSIRVIEVTGAEIRAEKDMIELLNSKALESEGIIFDKPFLNNVIGPSKFNEGDKVKVFWPGGAFQSAPALVKDTFFIMNVK